MIEWAKEVGKSVRQRSARQQATIKNHGTMPLYMYSKPMLIHDDIMMDDEGDNVTELVGAVEQGEQEFEFDDCSEDESEGLIVDKDDEGDDVSCEVSESESSETDEPVDDVKVDNLLLPS